MKEKEPLSFRLEPELHQRLEECAARTRIKKYALALLAIEAAVEAIEKNNYRLVVPIEFDVTHKPEPVKPAAYPPRDVQPAALNEPPNSGPPEKFPGMEVPLKPQKFGGKKNAKTSPPK